MLGGAGVSAFFWYLLGLFTLPVALVLFCAVDELGIRRGWWKDV